MAILAATPDGLYRVDGTVDRVLDVPVREVASLDDTSYAVTSRGLYEQRMEATTWHHIDSPTSDLHSLAIAGGVLVGARPLAVHQRTAGAWRELAGLRSLATSEAWPTPRFRDEAWARALAADSDRMLVGVEVGGLAVRDPDGTWRSAGPTEPDPQETQRCDDVHDVVVRRPDEWLLATGGGVFLTTDAGESWTRLETGSRRYARAIATHEDRLVVSVNESPPRWQPPDAALYAGAPEDLQRIDYPGEPERFVVSLASNSDTLYAGANDGTILRIADGEVGTVATVPVDEETKTAYGVQSLAVV